MDTSKWPQAWKDQYNEQIRLRKLAAKIKELRLEQRDEKEFPQLWNFNLSEETVFALIAFDFPLHRVIMNLLQRFVRPGLEHELRLSSRYLCNTEKICPAYYSDRERAVVILNRFQSSNEWETLFRWMSCFSERGYHPHMHLMLGILFLNKYLSHMHQDIWLIEAIHHLRRAEAWVKNPDCQKALSAVQALAWYLRRDFEKALSYLGVRQKKTFEEEFSDLIDKMAA